MARGAETIVEEWLNRQGYFTIRSLKAGRAEYDLMAVSLRKDDAVHVEVTSGIRPTGWIGKEGPNGEKLPQGKNRTEEEIALGIKGYLNKKYQRQQATDLRERLWPGREAWRFVFVHGKLDHPEELPYMRRQDVEVHDLRDLLAEMREEERPLFETDSDAAHFVALER